MKWMWGSAFVVVVVTAGLSAQSNMPTNEPNLSAGMTMTYTGCIAAVNHGGSFLLTHVDANHQTMIEHDGVMKSDAEMAKKDEPQASRDMLSDQMMSTVVVLTGRSEGYGSWAASRPVTRSSSGPGKRFSAIAFDYLVLFNPDSVVPVVERVVPGKGRTLTDIWRTRQFEYAWLRSIAGRYVDFWTVTDDALVYAASAVHVELTASQKQQLMDAYLHLTPWPDTVDALNRLRQSGIRVITIANLSPSMLRANAEHAGLSTFFEALLSTDASHTYKPDPRAYRLAVDYLRLPKEDIVFAAFGGWDAVGAKSFGYPTVWVNRFNQPAEELGVRPDQTVSDLRGLLDFVKVTPGPPDK